MNNGVEFPKGTGSAHFSSRVSVTSITNMPSNYVYFVIIHTHTHTHTEGSQVLLQSAAPSTYCHSKNPCLRQPVVQSNLGKDIPNGVG